MGETWMFIVTGLLVGVLSGILGIGGAVLLVPVLVLVFGFTQGRAQGTTLGALVPPIGIFAALQYYRNGMLDVRVAGLIAVGFVFGAFGGAALVPLIPQVWLKRIFASVLVYVAAQGPLWAAGGDRGLPGPEAQARRHPPGAPRDRRPVGRVRPQARPRQEAPASDAKPAPAGHGVLHLAGRGPASPGADAPESPRYGAGSPSGANASQPVAFASRDIARLYS